MIKWLFAVRNADDHWGIGEPPRILLAIAFVSVILALWGVCQ